MVEGGPSKKTGRRKGLGREVLDKVLEHRVALGCKFSGGLEDKVSQFSKGGLLLFDYS